MVKVDDKVVPLPYQKVFRGKKKESISVIKAGNSVSCLCTDHLPLSVIYQGKLRSKNALILLK